MGIFLMRRDSNWRYCYNILLIKNPTRDVWKLNICGDERILFLISRCRAIFLRILIYKIFRGEGREKEKKVFL